MSAGEDKSWVEQTLRGDKRAFECLVDKYYVLLFNIALRMVHDTEDARDVTQNAFLKAFEKLATYDDRHKFFSWIYRIMTNESINLIQARKPQEPVDTALVSDARTPEQDCAAAEVGRIVQAGLMRLTPAAREVIVLRHFADLSYREIASTLSIPEKTVKSRLFEARRRLGDILFHPTSIR